MHEPCVMTHQCPHEMQGPYIYIVYWALLIRHLALVPLHLIFCKALNSDIQAAPEQCQQELPGSS